MKIRLFCLLGKEKDVLHEMHQIIYTNKRGLLGKRGVSRESLKLLL